LEFAWHANSLIFKNRDMYPKHVDKHHYSWVEKYSPDRILIKGKSYLFLKRIMDLLMITLSSIFWLPLLGVIYFISKISEPDAPVFFTQERTGKGGERFDMKKIRTMVQNAEQLKEDLQDFNELEWPDFKISNDPRVTKFGKILRKASLDELPQLLNVLKGEMTIVGPRPTSFSPDSYDLWHTERLDVVPGITGLWQITGRGETEFDDRLRMDIAYIEHRCIMLDLEILVKTALVVLRGRGTH
jgi:lipopolysaccharide/colanic/teichoic acid biosynthesis glycosyltransferase